VSGWIEWSGGECPVAGDAEVEIQIRHGNLNIGDARAFSWRHGQGPFGYEGDDDIVAYRAVTEGTSRPPSALTTQIGGDHYQQCKIQPVEFIEANGLQFLEGCVVKRATRHDKPTGKGRQDIEKAIHELQLILALRYGEGQ
jgi:hypothetical protein